MNTFFIKKIRSKALLGLVSGLLGFSQIANAHDDDAYSHDYRAVASNPSWMANVDGTKRVSELSLPGTHDTMSIRAGDIWQNQTMTLAQQLESGIRVFDMRTRHINNTLRMHHGVISQDTYFNDVLNDIDIFLTANPSETVLFRLRSEHTPENNTQSYTQTLNTYLAANGVKRWVPTHSNPTLDDIRGQFVILQEFSGTAPDGKAYGLSYGAIDKQDDYSMSTNWALYDKWNAVKKQLDKSKNGNGNTIYMNYLSGANGSFPYFVVSGHSSPGTSAPRLATGLTTPGWNSSYPDFPRVSCFIGICTIAFEGTNTLTADYIASASYNSGVAGMVMTDFPGKRFIENVIKLNTLPKYRELRDARTGKCLDFEGTTPTNGKKALLWDCASVAWQKWSHDTNTGLLHNKANPAYCLDNMGQPYSGGGIHMWQCNAANINQQWHFVGNALSPKANEYISVDAYGHDNGSKIGLWSSHNGLNQQWNWGN
ncbi:phosphatidylinositol-specific phospholipase C domain-containing protein [Pseudomonas sp. HK3]